MMDNGWTLKELCARCEGRLHGTEQGGIRSLAFDSRRIRVHPSTLFVALKGKGRDGHQYVAGLYEQGLRSFLVSEKPDLSLFPEAGFCLVEDSLKALQLLGASRRKEFGGMVMALTGSNGKTIVKEWITQLLGGEQRIYRSPKSYNSQLGVPLSLWGIPKDVDLAVIEAGISRPGEMDRLREMIQARVGLFTHLGSAHQEHFESIHHKLEEKLKLFRDCESIVFRRDSVAGEALYRLYGNSGKELVDWSLSGPASYVFRIVPEKIQGLKLVLEREGTSYDFTLPFSDEASVENALHALSFSLFVGMDIRRALDRVARLEQVSMRLEILQGIGGSTLINDSYNADVAGLEAGLDLLNQQVQRRRKILILSDLLQSGKDEEGLYRELAHMCLEHGVSQIIGIGPAIGRQAGSFPPGSSFYPHTEAFLAALDPGLYRNSAVLIKGSRLFGFERIAEALQLRTHQTRLEIHMNALRHNLASYRAQLDPGMKLMVMVKALSYGSGHLALSRFLQHQGVDYLAVAYVDEGMELRRAGIHMPIMVMNAHAGALGQMIEYHLEPVVFSRTQFASIHSGLKYRQVSDFPVHLKIDTGMHRLGFLPEEIEDIGGLIQAEEVHLASVFSHLVASEDPSHDAFTRQQIEGLEKLVRQMGKDLGQSPPMHILNTAGIERFPEARFQMVRLGIGLYGLGQLPGLQTAVRFVSTVSQVKEIPEGESIGYGRSAVAGQAMRIATLPVGYADGLDRRLGGGRGKVWAGGRPVPIVGNICMDMCMVDVSGTDVREGDEVEIFGHHIPVCELAQWLGTIPYEVLTSVPERVKRVYLEE